MTDPKNPLELSDEDFLSLNGPPAAEEASADSDADADETDNSGESEDSSETDQTDQEASAEAGEEDAASEAEEKGQSGGDAAKDPDDAAESSASSEGQADPVKPEVKPEAQADKPSQASDAPIVIPTDVSELQKFYGQIMTPFKANGKTIKLKDPSEAITLMQMGANYTKKLQDIQPHRKMLLMLQNNNLLDEGKLSYLIDLDKKNPEAIKKLVKDAGIDPMDIDTSVEPNYLGGNHTVTDEEARFRETLEEITSTDTGREVLQTIDKTWDDVSKEALWGSPEIMRIIQTQHENGIYQEITAEMERRITLGKIAPGTPFIEAYKTVGDELFAPPQQQQQQQASQDSVKLAERAAVPKPQLKNGDKASAAAPSRNTPRKAQVLVNPLAMSDDEFLKQFENRL